MAQTTGVALEWLMLIDLHQKRGFRSVRIVTLPAIDVRTTEPEMELFESSSVAVVTAQTQFGHGDRQEHALRRVMRLMATQAFAPCSRGMRVLSFNELSDFRMAAQTNADLLIRKQSMQASSMHRMT